MSGRTGVTPRGGSGALAAAALVAAAAIVPSPAPAQPGTGPLDGEAALTTGTVAGSDFDNVGVGVGGELGVRYGLTPRLSVGLAGQASWHEAANLDGPLRLLGAHLEPRYRLRGFLAGLRPFVGGRLGLARWHVTESADTLRADVSAGGAQVGGTAGLSYPLSGRARLEAAAVASFLFFGDARVDATLGGDDRAPFVPEGSGTSGSYLGIRTLLSVRLP